MLNPTPSPSDLVSNGSVTGMRVLMVLMCAIDLRRSAYPMYPRSELICLISFISLSLSISQHFCRRAMVQPPMVSQWPPATNSFHSSGAFCSWIFRKVRTKRLPRPKDPQYPSRLSSPVVETGKIMQKKIMRISW